MRVLLIAQVHTPGVRRPSFRNASFSRADKIAISNAARQEQRRGESFVFFFLRTREDRLRYFGRSPRLKFDHCWGLRTKSCFRCLRKRDNFEEAASALVFERLTMDTLP